MPMYTTLRITIISVLHLISLRIKYRAVLPVPFENVLELGVVRVADGVIGNDGVGFVSIISKKKHDGVPCKQFK